DRAAYLELARPPDFVVLDNGSLVGRTAHIEADDIRDAEPACHCGRADHPSSRPRRSAVMTPPFDCIVNSGAVISSAPSPVSKRGQIPVQYRHDIGIRYCRASAQTHGSLATPQRRVSDTALAGAHGLKLLQPAHASGWHRRE